MTGIFSDLADLWNPARDYSKRPIDWSTEKASESLWSAQRDIMQSLADNRYTAVHAAHGLGKSKIASLAMGWWIDSHPIGEAFVISTAPTAAQVASILWRELTRLHEKAELPGRITRAGFPHWFIGNKEVGYGRKPADYQESAFQGIHDRYVLVVIDEACGVVQHIFDAIDALATNPYARVLAIGNPDDPGSHFAKICQPNTDWNVLHLDALRSPNFSKAQIIGHKSAGFGYQNPRYPLTWALMRAENIPFSTEEIPEYMVDLLTGPLWVEERIRTWAGFTKTAFLDYLPDELENLVRRRTTQSPIFQAKVRGVFPTESNTGVIPLGWVQLAVNRWNDLYGNPDDKSPASLRAIEPGRMVLGVDVAHGGEDETVFAHRYGNIVEKLTKYRIADTMEIADNVSSFMHVPGAVAVVDVIGVGAGVFDALRRYKTDGLIQGNPVAFNASAQSGRKDLLGQFTFRNDRSAAWWHMRELLDPSRGSNIALPDDERLIQELVTVQYKHNVGGVIQVEGKDEIKKRIGRSTDSADSVIQSFWVNGQPFNFEPIEWGQGRGPAPIKYGGYDPFTDEDFAVRAGTGTGSNFRPERGMGIGGGKEWWES